MNPFEIKTDNATSTPVVLDMLGPKEPGRYIIRLDVTNFYGGPALSVNMVTPPGISDGTECAVVLGFSATEGVVRLGRFSKVEISVAGCAVNFRVERISD